MTENKSDVTFSEINMDNDEWFVQKCCCEDEVTLKFDDDTELYVSAGFLIYASPVFRAMLTSDFVEKKNKIVNLPGKRYDDMLKFLKCMHPGILLRITSANVAIIAALADEYQVDTITAKCKEVLTIWLRRGHDYKEQDLLVKVPGKHPYDPKSEFNEMSNPTQFAPVTTGSGFGTSFVASGSGFSLGGSAIVTSNANAKNSRRFHKDVNVCLKVILIALKRNYNSIKTEAVSILSGIPFKQISGRKSKGDSAETDKLVLENKELFQNLPQGVKLDICQKRLWICDD